MHSLSLNNIRIGYYEVWIMNYSASINLKHNASWQWSCIKWLTAISGCYLLLFGVPGSLFNFLLPTAFTSGAGTPYDTAIVVLGGGLTSTGQLPPHSQLRVKKAEQLYRQLQSAGSSGTAPAIITLSGGTTHKPNPYDARGFPIWEASAAARDLAQIGIDPLHIYEENFSLDTVGNVSTPHKSINSKKLGLIFIVSLTIYVRRTSCARFTPSHQTFGTWR